MRKYWRSEYGSPLEALQNGGKRSADLHRHMCRKKQKIRCILSGILTINHLPMKKCLLWFSVPYVGIYSEMWEKCHDKVITVDNEQNAGEIYVLLEEECEKEISQIDCLGHEVSNSKGGVTLVLCQDLVQVKMRFSSS